MTKRQRYQSNTTDEMLLAWSKTSPLEKLKWLERSRQFYKKFAPKDKQLAWQKLQLEN